ncbi:MAG TPA: hypothetical protein VKX28_13075 [Xanthobacteraceae bacterium]|jgi:hypothetical protein|nr:hypothetical protein [Xanthobacteraceae bacterium]
MSANRSMKSDEPPAPAEMGRILPFEPRRKIARPNDRPPTRLSDPSPIEGLEKYSRPREDSEDYRYRMRANLAAIVLVGLLIWCGFWLFNTLAEMRKVQDCILMGRTNCAPISVPTER